MALSNQPLQYPAIDDKMPSEIDSFMYLTCREYAGLAGERANPNSIPVYRLIRLPLPQDLARSTGNQYSPEDSTASYNISKRSSAAAGQGVEALNPINQLGQIYDKAGGGLAGLAAAAAAGSSSLLSGFGLISGAVGFVSQAALDATSEMTTSRRTMMSQEMTWKNTEQRDFTFKWSLVPRGAADVDQISKICSAFEAYSLGQKDINSPLSRVLAPPMWTIQCKKNNIDITEQTIGTPKLCGISDVSIVNDTKSMVKDDEGQIYPMKTELVVKFTEIEPILFDREKDYNSGNPRDGILTRSESFSS